MPACRQCNSDYGSLEEDLLGTFALCIDPTDAAAAGVSKSVLNSMDPAKAKSPRDARARLKKRKSVVAKLLRPDQFSANDVLPGFEARGAEDFALKIPKQDLESLGKRLCEESLGLRRRSV